MPTFVSAKIAGCKHPVKRKTNDLSKLKYCQSDFKKIVFLRGGFRAIEMNVIFYIIF